MNFLGILGFEKILFSVKLTVHTVGGRDSPPLAEPPEPHHLQTVLPPDGRGGTDRLEASRAPGPSLCLELSNSKHSVLVLSLLLLLLLLLLSPLPQASPFPATEPPVEDLRVSGHRLVRILTVLGWLEVLGFGKQTKDLQSPNLLGLFSSPAENIGTTANMRHLQPGIELVVRIMVTPGTHCPH